MLKRTPRTHPDHLLIARHGQEGRNDGVTRATLRMSCPSNMQDGRKAQEQGMFESSLSGLSFNFSDIGYRCNKSCEYTWATLLMSSPSEGANGSNKESSIICTISINHHISECICRARDTRNAFSSYHIAECMCRARDTSGAFGPYEASEAKTRFAMRFHDYIDKHPMGLDELSASRLKTT